MYHGYKMNGVSTRRERATATITIGFAEREGRGVAYAVISGGRGPAVRVGFACRPLPALLGRDVAYAALDAIAGEMRERGLQRVVFRLDDDHLIADLDQRRALPNALIVPYVGVRCTLNRFREARVERCADGIVRDLTARARADVWFNLAA